MPTRVFDISGQRICRARRSEKTTLSYVPWQIRISALRSPRIGVRSQSARLIIPPINVLRGLLLPSTTYPHTNCDLTFFLLRYQKKKGARVTFWRCSDEILESTHSTFTLTSVLPSDVSSRMSTVKSHVGLKYN